MNEPQQEPIKLTGCHHCRFTGYIQGWGGMVPCMCTKDPLNNLPASTPADAPTGEAGDGHFARPFGGEDELSRADLLKLMEQKDATIATLRGECAGLMEDKARLDWLEAQSVLSLDWITPDGFSCGMNIDPNERLGAAPDLRKAIDAASRATEGK